MDLNKESLKMHAEKKGKIETCSKINLNNEKNFSLAYTPGVAGVCREIANDSSKVFDYTLKNDTIAVVSNGTAVLGLGNIGASASIPVMEGKAAIFKELVGLNAFPICIDSEDIDENVNIIRKISSVFGGINLEDYKSPECFEIEEKLQDLGIPVMHDDQHGTAMVILAGLINSLKLANKKKEDVRIVFSGAGAAAIATLNLLEKYGFDLSNFLVCDSNGIICTDCVDSKSFPLKEWIAEVTNLDNINGKLSDAIVGADVFIGLSKGGVLESRDISKMNGRAIVFALANPDPEILPDDAKDAFIVATGRSDFSNQVNNALIFPGVFRGALNVRAKRITDEMKIAAAEALAGMVENLSEKNILPKIFDKKVPEVVAKAVGDAWED